MLSNSELNDSREKNQVFNENNKDSHSSEEFQNSIKMNNTNLNEMFLMLQDTTPDGAPIHVKQLLEHLDKENLSKQELLFLVVYILVMEAGFVAKAEYEKCVNKLAIINPMSLFHAGNLREISRYKPSYNSLGGEFFCMRVRSMLITKEEDDEKGFNWLTGAVISNGLYVSLAQKNYESDPGFSVCLHMDRYVMSQHKIQQEALYSRLHNLKELHRVFRDEILVPRLNQLFSLLNFIVSPSLEGLPSVVHDQIFQHLSNFNISNLVQVSKTMYNAGCKKFKNVNKKSLSSNLKTVEEMTVGIQNLERDSTKEIH